MILMIDVQVNFCNTAVFCFPYIYWTPDDLLLTLGDIVPRHTRFSPIAATGYLKQSVCFERKAGQV